VLVTHLYFLSPLGFLVRSLSFIVSLYLLFFYRQNRWIEAHKTLKEILKKRGEPKISQYCLQIGFGRAKNRFPPWTTDDGISINSGDWQYQIAGSITPDVG